VLEAPSLLSVLGSDIAEVEDLGRLRAGMQDRSCGRRQSTELELAKSYCYDCPVRAACLQVRSTAGAVGCVGRRLFEHAVLFPQAAAWPPAQRRAA